MLYSRSTLHTRLDYWVSRYKAQKFLGICGGGCSGIRLPMFVLVRIRVIANPSDDEARKAVHQTSRFHLEAEHIQFSSQSISCSSVPHHLITRCNQPIMNDRYR